MNSFELLQQTFYNFLKNQFEIPEEILNQAQFELNSDSSKQNFGDINCNIAMICAQKLKKNPKTLADQIINTFQHPLIDRIELAGPGFLNFFLKQEWFFNLAQEITSQKDTFFKPTQHDTFCKKINVEFVSANPTGPMHVGHGRNGILGDVLANILAFRNNQVTKEFYINDAGVQITKLGKSFKIRCLQQLGQTIELPEDAYHGPYLIELAQSCVAQFGSNLEQEPDQFFESYAKNFMLKELQQTLQNYGIVFDVWFSEKSLHDSNKVQEALNKLIATGHTYEQDGAIWLRSTTFGDDKDRVLQKSDGQPTYILPDVAYLINKFERGFDEVFMILGHDHHSYKTRMQVIMQVLGYNPEKLTVILYQLVHIFKDGQPVKMSKRSGNMVTLEEVVEEVGTNVARFFFLNRKADAELQFDLNLALTQSNENPVYYIQYAYVRTISIHRNAQEQGFKAATSINQPCSDIEKLLLKKICFLKQLIANIEKNHQIHMLAYYTYELAGLFHQYYNQQRVIDSQNPIKTAQNLYFVSIVQQTLQLCFFLMGITPMQKM